MTVRFVQKDQEPQKPEAYAARAYSAIDDMPGFNDQQRDLLKELVRCFTGFVPSGYLVTDAGWPYERHYVDEPADGAVDGAYKVPDKKDEAAPTNSRLVTGKQATRPKDTHGTKGKDTTNPANDTPANDTPANDGTTTEVNQ